MHPVEVIRWVLRHPGGDDLTVAREVGAALAAMAGPERVLAARRVVAHQPANAPLRWLCARMLASSDPTTEAQFCIEALTADETALEVAGILPAGAACAFVGWEGREHLVLDERPDLVEAVVGAADVVIVAPVAAGEPGIVLGWDHAARLDRRGEGSTVVLAVATGRALPSRHLAHVGGLHGYRLRPASELGTGQRVVGPAGEVEAADPGQGLGALVDCPAAPELLVR